jgi:hypothetical protein
MRPLPPENIELILQSVHLKTSHLILSQTCFRNNTPAQIFKLDT